MAISPEGPGLVLAVVSTTLLSLSWLTVATRFLIRYHTNALGLDDWLMGAGLIFYSLACQATITAAYRGVGAHTDRLNTYYEQEGRKYFMFFQLFYVASTVPIKSSICVALLRITPRQAYKNILYLIMIFSFIAAFTTDIAVLTVCKPIAATWDKSRGHCAKSTIITNVSYFISSVSILTDWACAILPGFILWNVQLRFRLKVSVAVILSLGVFASTATLVRLKYLLAYNNPNDYLYSIANIAVWSVIESGIGLIAGSLPALRPLLRYLPFIRESKASGHRPGRSTRNTAIKLEDGMSSQKDGMPYSSTRNHEIEIGRSQKNWDDTSETGSQTPIVKDPGQITITDEVHVTTTGPNPLSLDHGRTKL